MFVKNEEFQTVTFLTKTVYHDLAYPDFFKMKHKTKNISGLNAEIFEFDEFDVLVFSGTNFTSIRDWYANFKMALGIKPKQFYNALEFVSENYNQNKKTFVVGHSLGGAIASYIGNHISSDNVILITYNGAGIRHLVKPKHTNNMYNLITSKDILNNITKYLPFNYFKHIGKSTVICDNISKNCIKSHSNFHVFMSFDFESLQNIEK